MMEEEEEEDGFAAALCETRGVVVSEDEDRPTNSRPVRRSVMQPTPTLYVFNCAAITKPHAIEQLTTEFHGYGVNICVLCEAHLKSKHADGNFNIPDYTLLRRDRGGGRRGGGIAIYIRSIWKAQIMTCTDDRPIFEVLWVRINTGSSTILIGAIYHPQKPMYLPADLISYLECSVAHPGVHIILAGDVNTLSNTEVMERTSLTEVVAQPTRGENQLDRLYVSDPNI